MCVSYIEGWRDRGRGLDEVRLHIRISSYINPGGMYINALGGITIS